MTWATSGLTFLGTTEGARNFTGAPPPPARPPWNRPYAQGPCAAARTTSTRPPDPMGGGSGANSFVIHYVCSYRLTQT